MAKGSKITSVDEHIAKRIRERRKAIGMTLEELAVEMRLTYQQVQKYEGAINRVSASRLYDIARHLDVSVGYFFEGLPKK